MKNKKGNLMLIGILALVAVLAVFASPQIMSFFGGDDKLSVSDNEVDPEKKDMSCDGVASVKDRETSDPPHRHGPLSRLPFGVRGYGHRAHPPENPADLGHFDADFAMEHVRMNHIAVGEKLKKAVNQS